MVYIQNNQNNSLPPHPPTTPVIQPMIITPNSKKIYLFSGNNRDSSCSRECPILHQRRDEWNNGACNHVAQPQPNQLGQPK